MRDLFSNDTGPTCDDTTTCERSRRLLPTTGRATSSSVATRVRRTAAPGSGTERERRHSALNSSALLRSFARASFFGKTPPERAPMLPGLGSDSETSSNGLATRSCPSDSAPVALALTTSGTGCSCSPQRPTPTASMFWCRDVEQLLARRERCRQQHRNGNGFGLTIGQWCAIQRIDLTPELVEAMLGFPVGWTDCAASATRLTFGSHAPSGSAS